MTWQGVLTKSEEDLVRTAFRVLQERCHALAKEKGWYDQERSVPEVIALMHSELSEALEAYRGLGPEQHPRDTWARPEDGKPEGVPVEFADCLIRIFDTCEHLGIELGDVLIAKHAFNGTREHRHGGKRA
jgi:hypothetical protein